jgi:hypothetical protein
VDGEVQEVEYLLVGRDLSVGREYESQGIIDLAGGDRSIEGLGVAAGGGVAMGERI